MKEPLPRIDTNSIIRKELLRYCRLKYGEIWEDSVRSHRVGVLDSCKTEDMRELFGKKKAVLIVNDPPYNLAVGNKLSVPLFRKDIKDYVSFSREWIRNTTEVLKKNASLYIWLGADQNDNFQPLPEFILLMREFPEFRSRSFITMRNQRGYGTLKNWMTVRQELLYYTKGQPFFNVNAEYTDIPRILKGYYKNIRGKKTENTARSRSPNIRAGNVWVDIQQIFYLMEENISGCYAQKPLKAIERIILAASLKKDLIADFFSHSGTTLLAGERLQRKVFTCDLDPVFAEITIRRLEHFRKTGKTGFGQSNPFPELNVKRSI